MNSKMQQETIKVPKERIAVLIGPKGSTKRKIEKETSTKLVIDSNEGDVTINSEDPYQIFITIPIIKAIARGFNPEKALQLLNENFCFEMITITDIIGKSKNDLIRLKARLIGSKGKARRSIEYMTNTKISIYGKTVCIIGNVLDVMTARQAIERILLGAKHSNVYAWIEKQKEV